MRRIATALALLSAAAVVAAPVPPPTEKERLAKDWGKTDGAGEFELNGQRLTVRSTTGKPNVHSWQEERVAVPRTARTVKGDFVITVRIVDAVPPRKNTDNESGWAATNAGLYLQGPSESLRYNFSQVYHQFPGADTELHRSLGLEAHFPNGAASGGVTEAERGKTKYLRLIRKGKEITMSNSADGETWSEPNNPFAGLIQMDLPDELTAGVYYSHSTSQFGHASFDKFTIEKPQVEKLKVEKPK